MAGNKKCPSCGEDNKLEATFCRYCTKPIGDYKILSKCTYCGGAVEGGGSICKVCEKKYSADLSPLFYFVVALIVTAVIAGALLFLRRPWVNR